MIRSKSQNRKFAKQQVPFLNVVGPITSILEEADNGKLDQKLGTEEAQTSPKLLDNVSMYA